MIAFSVQPCCLEHHLSTLCKLTRLKEGGMLGGGKRSRRVGMLMWRGSCADVVGWIEKARFLAASDATLSLMTMFGTRVACCLVAAVLVLGRPSGEGAGNTRRTAQHPDICTWSADPRVLWPVVCCHSLPNLPPFACRLHMQWPRRLFHPQDASLSRSSCWVLASRSGESSTPTCPWQQMRPRRSRPLKPWQSWKTKSHPPRRKLSGGACSRLQAIVVAAAVGRT